MSGCYRVNMSKALAFLKKMLYTPGPTTEVGGAHTVIVLDDDTVVRVTHYGYCRCHPRWGGTTVSGLEIARDYQSDSAPLQLTGTTAIPRHRVVRYETEVFPYTVEVNKYTQPELVYPWHGAEELVVEEEVA